MITSKKKKVMPLKRKSGNSEEDDDPENSEENENVDDGNVNVLKKLHETWCCLSPSIVGKQFAGICETKRSKRLCIGQAMA